MLKLPYRKSILLVDCKRLQQFHQFATLRFMDYVFISIFNVRLISNNLLLSIVKGVILQIKLFLSTEITACGATENCDVSCKQSYNSW